MDKSGAAEAAGGSERPPLPPGGHGDAVRHDARTGWLVIALVTLGWQALAMSGMLPPYTLPSPLAVARRLAGAAVAGELAPALFWSAFRVVAGFALAVAMAVPIGFAMGWSRRLDALLYPVLYVLRPIPPMAWIPLAILWFGIRMSSDIFITFLGAFFPILLHTSAGVRAVDRRMVEFAMTLGARTFHLLVRVAWPAALPAIFTGMRTGLGTAWICVVAAEMIAAKSGLGYLIYVGRYAFDTPLIVGGMLVIGALGLLTDWMMRAIEERWFRWRRELVQAHG